MSASISIHPDLPDRGKPLLAPVIARPCLGTNNENMVAPVTGAGAAAAAPVLPRQLRIYHEKARLTISARNAAAAASANTKNRSLGASHAGSAMTAAERPTALNDDQTAKGQVTSGPSMSVVIEQVLQQMRNADIKEKEAPNWGPLLICLLLVVVLGSLVIVIVCGKPATT